MDNNSKISLLKELILEVTGRRCTVPIDESTPLFELKLDSLDIVELQLLYEDKTGISTLDSVDPVITVGNLIALMP